MRMGGDGCGKDESQHHCLQCCDLCSCKGPPVATSIASILDSGGKTASEKLGMDEGVLKAYELGRLSSLHLRGTDVAPGCMGLSRRPRLFTCPIWLTTFEQTPKTSCQTHLIASMQAKPPSSELSPASRALPRPTVVTFSAAISACDRWWQALQLLILG